MIRRALVAVAAALVLGPAAAGPPFVLEAEIVIPDVPWGPYSDYLATDVAGGRLFATPQAAHAVAVFDVRPPRFVTLVRDIGNPHGVYYDGHAGRLFVDDGATGTVKVFDGATLALVKEIPVTAGANGLAFDPSTRLLYVNNGGEDAGLDHSVISVIDTAQATKVADIPVDGASLEASVIDPARHRLYVNVWDKNAVAVYDLGTRALIATWPLRNSRHNIAIALDRRQQRLYVGCRDGDMRGSIAVMDARDGRELRTLPIGGWVDSIDYDERRRRVYASSGTGHLETYQFVAATTYRRLASLDTAVMAKTSVFSQEFDRLYVSVPHLGDTPAKVMVFKPVP